MSKIKNLLIQTIVIIVILLLAFIITYSINMLINSVVHSEPNPLNKNFKSDSVNIYIINNSIYNKKIGNYIIYPKSSLIYSSKNGILYIEGNGKIEDNITNKVYSIKEKKVYNINIIKDFLDNSKFYSCNYMNNDIKALYENYDNNFFIEIDSQYNNKQYTDTIYLMEDSDRIKILEVTGSIVKLSTNNIHIGILNYNCSGNIFIQNIEKLISKTII